METDKSEFRKLLEFSNKAAKEVLGNYYIISESRMENYLHIMESGAEQIKSQEEELEQLHRRLADTEIRLQDHTYCHSDQAVEDYVQKLEAKLAEVTTEKDEAIKNYKLTKSHIKQLNVQLTTIKQDTAVKCAEIVKREPFWFDASPWPLRCFLAKAIRKHFNLKKLEKEGE